MEERALVTNIQRFSLHDGPGIRTTIFCKGCALRCPWCSNPENLEPYPEEYVKGGRRGTYGRYMTCDEIYQEVIKDSVFYDQKGCGGGLSALPGGVTLSGGEPLLQMKKLEPLLRKLKAENIHRCVETSLFAPTDALRLSLELIDLFYVDIKILDDDACGRILGGDLQRYLSNVDLLFQAGIPVVLRVPVIGGYTDGAENRRAVAELVRRCSPRKVELLKEHGLGRSKYESLGKKAIVLGTVTDEAMEGYKEEMESYTGIETEICRV